VRHPAVGPKADTLNIDKKTVGCNSYFKQ